MIAKFIDFLVIVALAAILPRVIGPLLGFFYCICGDGFRIKNFNGQSLGKKLLRLKVRNTVRNGPANFKDSMIRNSPLGLATFFAIIPIWGWIILVLVGVPLVVMEIYLMMRVETRLRLGDVMADTEVVFSTEKLLRKKSSSNPQ